jgi:hypothetical protein
MNLNLLSVLLGTLILPVELMLELTGMSADRSNPAPVILTCLVAIAFMVRTCSRVRRLRYITAISCSWWAICVGFIGWRACQLYGWSWVNVQTLGSCITIGALYALWAYAWHVLSNRRKILAYLIAATFPFLFVLISVTNMTQAISNLPKVYDPTIYAIQTTMHLDGSRLFAVAAQEFNPFKRVMVFMYTSTPIWMLLAALLQSLNAQAEHSWFLLCSFILGLAGFGLYYVTPAIGPVYYFGAAFPNQLPQVAQLGSLCITGPSPTFRNAMPSLHAASALLIYLAVRQSAWWYRMLGSLSAICIMMSTLALGEHYAVDLIAAFPLILCIRGLCAANVPLACPARYQAVIGGAVLISLWCLAVRNGYFSLQAPWALDLLGVSSLLVPITLERLLYNREVYLFEADSS